MRTATTSRTGTAPSTSCLRRCAPRKACDELWLGLRDGDVQTIGTDHCPFNFKGQKDMGGKDDYKKIPNGAPGIETMLMLMHTEGVVKGRITLERMVDVLSTSTARMFGLRGQGRHRGRARTRTSWCSIPKRKFTITQKKLHQNVDYTPWEGFEMTGMPEIVYSRGQARGRMGRRPDEVRRRERPRQVRKEAAAVGFLAGAWVASPFAHERTPCPRREPMETTKLRVNGARLRASLEEMAKIGATPAGGVHRLALSDEDKKARDLFVKWLKEINLTVTMDEMGNHLRPKTREERLASARDVRLPRRLAAKGGTVRRHPGRHGRPGGHAHHRGEQG